jgi:hypothetical protein
MKMPSAHKPIGSAQDDVSAGAPSSSLPPGLLPPAAGGGARSSVSSGFMRRAVKALPQGKRNGEAVQSCRCGDENSSDGVASAAAVNAASKAHAACSHQFARHALGALRAWRRSKRQRQEQA